MTQIHEFYMFYGEHVAHKVTLIQNDAILTTCLKRYTCSKYMNFTKNTQKIPSTLHVQTGTFRTQPISIGYFCKVPLKTCPKS